jgi:hypothetical protein
MIKEKTKSKFNTLAIIAIIIFCVAIAPISLQNDTFYTIKIGELILQNGIDMQDHFSWHENLPYTYPHWAYDVGMYLIYALAGMDGIYISTCILSAILGLVLYAVNSKLVKNNLLSFLITLGAIYMLKDFIAARAQLVTFILFILTIFCIEKFLETKKKRYAISLVVIPTIIANVHTAVWPFYFILFLPYIGEYIVAVMADRIMRTMPEKSKEKRRKEKENAYKLNIVRNENTKWLIVIMLICAFTGLLTPLGDTPYTYLVKTMQGNTTQNINEHLPLTLSENQPVMCLLILYIALLTFTKVKIRLNDLFMIGGLALLMFCSKRQSTMFVLIGSVVLNRTLYQAMEIYCKGLLEKATKEAVTKFGILIILALTLGVSFYFMDEKSGDVYIKSSSYPVEACDYILENLDVDNIKLYNDYNYGSYLIYRNIPVFIDSRADLYAPEFNTPTGNKEDGRDIFMDFINVSGIATYYDSVFEQYDITHVLTTKNSKMNMLISKRDDSKYNLLYSDDYFVVYEITDNN